MFTAHHARVAFGVVATVVACSHPAVREMPDYRGATLERVREVPEVAAAAAAAGMMGSPFPGSCAQTLRVTSDGQELRLMKSKTETTGWNHDGTATTRLVGAVGEYAVVTPRPLKDGPLPRLQVDCVSGKATGWIGQ